MAELILGVDGGGSKTRAVVADASGALLGAGASGSSNAQAVGRDAAVQSLRAAIEAALAQAGLHDALPLAAACLGLAGAGRPDERAWFASWIERERIAVRHTIVTDVELALAAGTPSGWGVALIGGTGSIAYGRTRDGRAARAGGWGYVLGDEGGGYDIAARALRLAAQTADARAEAGALLDALLDACGLDAPEQLIRHIYQPEMTPARVAALAAPVLCLAEAGDPHAAALIEDAARDLAALAATVARKLALEQPPLALGGGLLVASDDLRQRVSAHLQAGFGPVRLVDDPAQGAVIIARGLVRG